ncbi:MAG: hypothetical protein IT430_15685 [Phycisphaerales bacterium]|nr:hypothetical protein [Phycisphaerales bacterium]
MLNLLHKELDMQSIDWVAVLFRWMHIVPAIVLLGGTIFLAIVAVPTTSAPDGAPPPWLGKVRKRWAMLAGVCILLLLVSGLWNFMVYRLPEVKEIGLYHALFGTKVLLSLAVFFIASVMAGRSPAFDRMRSRPGKMLMITAVLGLLVVLLAGVLRGVHQDTNLPGQNEIELPNG